MEIEMADIFLWKESSERGQNKRYRESFVSGDHTLSISVNLDTSYDFQSSATIKRWNGSEWHTVATILSQNIRSIEQARDELIKRAKMVLS